MTTGPEPPKYGRAATRLRALVPPGPVKLRRGEGAGGGREGRMSQLRRSVTCLIDQERLELPWTEATEVRLYTERLIQEAVFSAAQQDLDVLLRMWNGESAETEQQQGEGLLVPLSDESVNPAILELAVFWLTKPELVEKLFKVSWLL